MKLIRIVFLLPSLVLGKLILYSRAVVYRRYLKEIIQVLMNGLQCGMEHYKGQFVESGTYIYLAEMGCVSGEIFTFKGTVTLVK